MPFEAMRFRKSTVTSYLDLLGVTPRAVLSLRKLISTATVSIRVRRSSDNTEQDIGFSGGVLDTASLASFVGANSGFVTTFYDQTGNLEHAVQATAANQPRIVNAGVYDGRLIFDGTNDNIKITSLTLGAPYLGVYSKALIPSATVGSIFFETSTAWNAGQGAAVYASTTVVFMASSNAPTTNNRTRSFSRPASLGQMTWLYNRAITGTSELSMWSNGSSLTGTDSGTTEQTGNYSSNDINIGSRNGASDFLAANIETLVFYNADSSSIRASIEALVA